MDSKEKKAISYGKGSKRRPRYKRCSLEEFYQNWERVFGSKKKNKNK